MQCVQLLSHGRHREYQRKEKIMPRNSRKSSMRNPMGGMSTKAKVIAIIVAVVVIMVGTIIGYRKIGGIFNPKKAEPEITTTIVSRQLQTMQDLTTAKENDYGFEEFSEGNIAHVNKKKFTMFYSYEILAGVDLAKAEIKVHDDTRTISITLPKATLQSVSVDPDSLRFFDSESSLFNGNEVTDTAEALKHAKKSASDKASKSELLQEADKQAKQIVEKAYSPIAKADGYKVQVQLANK